MKKSKLQNFFKYFDVITDTWRHASGFIFKAMVTVANVGAVGVETGAMPATDAPALTKFSETLVYVYESRKETFQKVIYSHMPHKSIHPKPWANPLQTNLFNSNFKFFRKKTRFDVCSQTRKTSL